MDALEKEGLLLPGTRTDFAANEIVVLVPAAADSAVSSFADLAKPAAGRIAVGNPATSPAGRYAAEVLAQTGIAEAVKAKLVPAETVRQILDWVARGEVDAGIAYATDAAGRPQGVRIAAAAPAGSHQPIVYPIAVLGGRRAPLPPAPSSAPSAPRPDGRSSHATDSCRRPPAPRPGKPRECHDARQRDARSPRPLRARRSRRDGARAPPRRAHSLPARPPPLPGREYSTPC